MHQFSGRASALIGMDASLNREEIVQLLWRAPTVKCESDHLRENKLLLSLTASWIPELLKL